MRFRDCVASVSVGFRSKEKPRNGIFGVFPARKMWREPKKRNVRGGRGQERKRLQTNPSPSPSPSLVLYALAPFFAQAQRENPVPLTFFTPQPHRNVCYVGYLSDGGQTDQAKCFELIPESSSFHWVKRTGCQPVSPLKACFPLFGAEKPVAILPFSHKNVYFIRKPCESHSQYKDSHIFFFAIFVPVLTKLYIIGLNFSVCFYEDCLNFCALWLMANIPVVMLFSYQEQW